MHPDRPPVMKECEIIFDKAFGLGFEDFFDEDMSVGTTFLTTPPLCSVTLQAASWLSVRVSGLMGLSFPVPAHLSGTGSLFIIQAAIIQSLLYRLQLTLHIVVREDHSIVYAVYNKLPASPGAIGPFQFYSDFPAKIYYPCLSPDLQIIHSEWIKPRCARWNMDDRRAVVLTLSRDVFCL